LGVRDTQKQETRARVLAAARDLFDEVGYEGATIRLVAQHAGVSIGSVFTTFSSKADILSQVMQDRLEGVADAVETLPQASSALERIKAILAVYYRYEMQRPKLFLAHLVTAFTPDQEAEVIPFGGADRALADARTALIDGVSRGEISPAADLDMVIDMVRAIYAWNYRLAARAPVDADHLASLSSRQIDLLFEGLKAR
jgi:AcrR family transcriptional regulator